MNNIKRYIYIQARPNFDRAGADNGTVKLVYVRVVASSEEAALKKGFKLLLEQDGYNGRVANDLVIPVREQKDEAEAQEAV